MVLCNNKTSYFSIKTYLEICKRAATTTKNATPFLIPIARYSNKTGEKSCALIAIKMVTLQMATTKAMSITIDNAKPKLQ